MIPRDPTITIDVEVSVSPDAAGDWKGCYWVPYRNVERDNGKEYWIDCNRGPLAPRVRLPIWASAQPIWG